MKAPYWSLKVIKQLAESGSIKILGGRALKFFGDDRRAATAAALEAIESLTSRNFAHTISQVDICDVYGVVRNEHGWYLKITVVKPELIVISLHPLERPLMTNGGMVNP